MTIPKLFSDHHVIRFKIYSTLRFDICLFFVLRGWKRLSATGGPNEHPKCKTLQINIPTKLTSESHSGPFQVFIVCKHVFWEDGKISSCKGVRLQPSTMAIFMLNRGVHFLSSLHVSYYMCEIGTH